MAQACPITDHRSPLNAQGRGFALDTCAAPHTVPVSLREVR